MFVGSVNRQTIQTITEYVRSTGCKDIYVGCSGNFTIERSLASDGLRLHSNDVSLYSSLLGKYLAGEEIEVNISEDMQEEYGWLQEYMGTMLDRLATLSILTRALQQDPSTNLYTARMWKATKAQFPRMHEGTKERMSKLNFNLESFYCGDVVDFIETVPEEAFIICYPPTYKSGYERLYRNIDKIFVWDKPHYEMFDPETFPRLVNMTKHIRYRAFATDTVYEEVDLPITAMVQTTPRSRPTYTYSNVGRRVCVPPTLKHAKNNIRKLKEGDRIEPDGSLSFAKVSSALFNEVRYQYLNPNIPPGSPTKAYLVSYDDKVIGGISADKATMDLNTGYLEPAFLLADFAVDGSDYKYLSKLVLYVTLSKEFELEMRTVTSRPIRSIQTVAFSKHTQSMKYRGLYEKYSSRKTKDPALPWANVYWSPTGRWSLQEGLADWIKRYGDIR